MKFRKVGSISARAILLLCAGVCGHHPANGRDAPSTQNTILILGDSLTAGYGLAPEQAFPALIEAQLQQLSLDYKVIAAGLSGETTAGGKRRVAWLLKRPVNIFILALGANDGLRGIDLSSTQENLQAIIDQVRRKYPDAQLIIAGMQIPPNLGIEYQSEFKSIFPKIAEDNLALLIPFLLEGVAGIPELNLEDGIHPNPEGHAIIAETVLSYLLPIINKN